MQWLSACMSGFVVWLRCDLQILEFSIYQFVGWFGDVCASQDLVFDPCANLPDPASEAWHVFHSSPGCRSGSETRLSCCRCKNIWDNFGVKVVMARIIPKDIESLLLCKCDATS